MNQGHGNPPPRDLCLSFKSETWFTEWMKKQQDLYVWMLKVRRDILAHEEYFDRDERQQKWTDWKHGTDYSLGPKDPLDTVKEDIRKLGGGNGDPGNPPMPPF